MSAQGVVYQHDTAEPGVVRVRLDPEVAVLTTRARRLAEELNATVGALGDIGVSVRIRTWRKGTGAAVGDVVSLEAVIPVPLAALEEEPPPAEGPVGDPSKPGGGVW